MQKSALSPFNAQNQQQRRHPPARRPMLAKSPTFPFPSAPSTSSPFPSSISSSIHLHNCPALAELKKRREESRKRAAEAASSLAKSTKKPSGAHVKRPNFFLKMTDAECTGFEPQNYLKERCKKCFRLREKHGLSPLNKFPEKNGDREVLVLSHATTTAKRTQSIPTAQRRVPVKRSAKNEEEENEGKKANGKIEAKKEGGRQQMMMMKVIKVETQEDEEKERERGEECPKATTMPTNMATNIVALLPKTRTTTTVLLPKQRQISLGSSSSAAGGGGLGEKLVAKEKKPAKEEGGEGEKGKGRNGWQFMGKEFGAAAMPENGGAKAGGNGGGGGGGNGNGETESGGEEDLLSQSSYWTANSRGGGANSSNSQGEMFSARSIDSLNSLSYAESFKTGKSPPFDEDDPFVTPTSTDVHFFANDDTAIDEFDARALTPTAANQLEFNHLRVENQRLTEQCRRYRQERRRWTEWLKRQRERGGGGKGKETNEGAVGNGNGGGKRMAEEALTELELMVSEYREENSALKCELDRAREKDMSASALTLMNGGGMDAQKQQQLEAKLEAAECACEQLRKEREELEQELEEMQDQYRVEEIEEFRELQRELEQNAKNCRILQFKLRKSERQREQLQTEKNLLAKKYQELGGKKDGESQMGEELESETDESSKHSAPLLEKETSRKVAELEQELRVAKEISVKLHNELEMAEERRYRMEDELFYNKEKVRELLAQNKWREAKNSREQQTRTREVLSGERPEQELHREVRDSMEREADLREQLRFTESDLQRTRHRLRELELENDDLLQKYIKLADQQAQQAAAIGGNGSGGGGGVMLAVPSRRPNLLFRSISEGNDGKMAKQQEGGQILMSPTKLRKISESDETKPERKDSKESTADAEQLCYMLAAMDAQANRICKQLEKLDSNAATTTTTGSSGEREDKREKRRSLKGDIFPVLEELAGLLAEMKAIKEQLAKSQNISLTKSMILGSVLGDNKQHELEGEGGEGSCSECEDSVRKVDELKESCDFYKRKNAQLTEQILQMKDQWAEESRRTEDEAEERGRRMAKEIAEMRGEMDEQRVQIRAGEKALEESRAELSALNKRLAETTLEMERAKERAAAGGAEKGMEMARKWEAKYKEMKGERIQLQAEVGQLKRRTDEAVQELDKMRAAHQQKEIGWIREKLKLEEQIKQQKEGGNQQIVGSTNGEEEAEKEGLKRRIAELEKEKERLERELAEGKAAKGGGGLKEDEGTKNGQKQEMSSTPQQVQKLVQIQRREASNGNGAARPLLVVGGGGKEQQQPSQSQARTPSRVDYKQIADNALKAAESLQRQYREYQRQYTAEVQRLNTQLGQLERELADRERRLREHQQPTPQMAQQQGTSGGIQMQQPQIRRAMESPSMSSLTENTTWDSRLLDCSMTRSISPFKFPRGTCPMMQCRTMEIHPGPTAHNPQDIGDFGSEEDVHREYRRTGSSGTNILYRIRREELSKGKNPSVRQMAKAFENFEKVHQQQEGGGGNGSKEGQKATKKKKSMGAKSPLFGLLSKASSMEHQQQAAHGGKLPPKRKQSQGGEGSPVPSEPHSMPMCSSATLPRGGRNPFKGMGSRIVERVRRSLSRSKKSQSRDGTPSLMASTMTPAPPEEPTPWK